MSCLSVGDTCFSLSSKTPPAVPSACAVSPACACAVHLGCLRKESSGTCKHSSSLEQGRVLTCVFLASHMSLSSQENASHPKVAAPLSVPFRSSGSEAEMHFPRASCPPNQFPLSLRRLSCRNSPWVLPAT